MKINLLGEARGYLSEPGVAEFVCSQTGLAPDELESIVGRFRLSSHRAGRLRGEFYSDGYSFTIRHHFTKKILWTTNLNQDNIN